MELKNCAECGKVFVHPSRDVCRECFDTEEQDFLRAKEYLWEKTTATVEEVHQMTGVSVKRITKFARLGRFASAGLKVDLHTTCEGCGQPIAEGRFCYECRDRIITGFTEPLPVSPDRKDPLQIPRSAARGGKMYTADRERRR